MAGQELGSLSIVRRWHQETSGTMHGFWLFSVLKRRIVYENADLSSQLRFRIKSQSHRKDTCKSWSVCMKFHYHVHIVFHIGKSQMGPDLKNTHKIQFH
jgi:hypothetical protein